MTRPQSNAGSTAARGDPAQLQASSWGLVLVLLVLGLIASVVWQMQWGTVADTSWLIHTAERMLAGDRLYVDVIETNPPFSVWLYLPVVWLAQRIGVAAELIVHAYTYVLVFAGLCLAGLVAHRAQFAENPKLFRLSPLFLALFILYPGNAFTERDHIGTVLLLPLLVLTAWRARPVSVARPSRALAVAVGLSASVLVVVKPYYAVVVLVPAIYAAWRSRRWQVLFSLEYWTIGLVCTAYLAAVMRFHPEFLRDLYPVLAETYLQIDVYLPILVNYGVAYSVFVLIAWFLRPVGRDLELSTVALLASLAAFSVALYQAKGWPYHVYPALVLAIAAALCSMAACATDRVAIAGRWRPSLTIVLIAVLANWIPFRFSQKPDAETVAAVRSAVEQPSVAVLGTDMAIGHPFTRMVGGRWISAYNGDWLGSFAEHLGQEARANGDKETAARYEQIVAGYAATKRREFEQSQPDIVLVQKDDGIWNRRLLDDFGFASILAGYRPLVEDEIVSVYLRADLGGFVPLAK